MERMEEGDDGRETMGEGEDGKRGTGGWKREMMGKGKKKSRDALYVGAEGEPVGHHTRHTVEGCHMTDVDVTQDSPTDCSISEWY